ncbi:hypothetical protein BST79_gp204 [Only Syngen Nebraska virus 5]|uniref:hypothetical protein n=1 Tax=Only Syngen Nebraska virus 5 TaxID=1917232 RepID=UPI000900B51B|nr:hypothetical protein BST79_gp204 [Only Syngen Nebraska virus 5]APC25717.1 hypothetical protein [Only Syngen Nebraska virus 5]
MDNTILLYIMDFRDISPRSLNWRRGAKGVIYANRISGEKKIQFQIPKCNCTVSVHSPGMFRLEMKLNPADPIHQQFIRWISDLEESCKGPWGNLRKSSTIYNNGIRFMFFADTNAFDSSGTLSADYLNAKSAGAIISLVGLWTTQEKYGLKFKVEQFKFDTTSIPYPDVDEHEEISHNEKKFLFLDDE